MTRQARRAEERRRRRLAEHPNACGRYCSVCGCGLCPGCDGSSLRELLRERRALELLDELRAEGAP